MTAGVLALSPAVASAQDGHYIVVMKDDATATDTQQSQQQARREGGEIGQQFTHLIDGFSAELDADTARRLRQDSDVAYVEPDGVVSVQAAQAGAPWGLDRIDQRALPLNTTYDPGARSGKGVKAYILDTGVRANQPELAPRVASGKSFVVSEPADDCNGHGTAVASLVGGRTYGVAKDATIVPVKVLNCQGSGTWSDVIAGIGWVTADHKPGQPAVANMSLAGAQSQAINDALEASVKSGVTWVVAAGNTAGDACTLSPASAPSAIAVGATDNTDRKASYSSIGKCVSLFAPGTGITAASLTGTQTMTGTSASAPAATGVAALFLQANPTAMPATVRAALVDGATQGAVMGLDAASPNRLLFANF